MTTSQRRNYLIAALAFATLIKLLLAAETHGSTDVDAFTDQLMKIRELGVNVYYVRGIFGNPFNHPPPMIHILKFLGAMADKTGWPFGFWLRVVPSIADIGSVVIVFSLLKDRTKSFPLAIAFALCPISIIINGYHGNTDALMMMFVLLSIYCVEKKLLLAGGFALGAACSVKVVPVLFVPVLILYLSDIRSRAEFSIAAIGTFFIFSLPYITEEPITILRSLFGYGSIYGSWGLPQLLAIFSTVQYAHRPYEPLGIHAGLASILKYLLLSLICALAVWMNRRHYRPPLLTQCGLTMSVFLFLTPGFGPQYLVWLVPFVTTLGLRETLAFYCVGGMYLGYKYLGFAEVSSPPVWPIGFMLSICCWLMMYFFCRKYLANIRSANYRALEVATT